MCGGHTKKSTYIYVHKKKKKTHTHTHTRTRTRTRAKKDMARLKRAQSWARGMKVYNDKGPPSSVGEEERKSQYKQYIKTVRNLSNKAKTYEPFKEGLEEITTPFLLRGEEPYVKRLLQLYALVEKFELFKSHIEAMGPSQANRSSSRWLAKRIPCLPSSTLLQKAVWKKAKEVETLLIGTYKVPQEIRNRHEETLDEVRLARACYDYVLALCTELEKTCTRSPPKTFASVVEKVQFPDIETELDKDVVKKQLQLCALVTKSGEKKAREKWKKCSASKQNKRRDAIERFYKWFVEASGMGDSHTGLFDTKIVYQKDKTLLGLAKMCGATDIEKFITQSMEGDET